MNFKRLNYLGVKPENSPIENRKIQLLNIVLIMVITFLGFYIIHNIVLNQFLLVLIESILLILYSSLLYLQSIGKTILARDILIFSLQIFICVFILFLSPGKMGEYVLFLILFLQLIFYNNKVTLLVMYFFNLTMFYLPQLLFHPYPDENFSWANPLVTFVAMPLIVYFFHKSWERSETEIYRKNEALNHLLKERAKLVSIMAHDLKSPLSRIEGLTNLLEIKGVSEDQGGLIKMIRKVSQDQSSMILNVLNLQSERNTGAEDSIQLNTENIIPSLKEILYSFYYKANEKDIKIIDFYEAEEIYALIEPIFFKSVVENLISNAIKYSYAHSQISVKIITDEKYVHLSVSDTGIGISDKDQKNLFFAGKIKDSKPIGNESSTGIGLSIVHFYMLKMRGEIKFQSQLGEGSTFTASFLKKEVNPLLTS